jgi:predicted aspartyl protease
VSATFRSKQGPVYVEVQISGPTGRSNLRLLLDTGATTTLIELVWLSSVGYDPATSTDRVKVAMGGGSVLVPRVTLNRLSALGQHRIGFAVVCHPLPSEAGVDGLLGLDFFRDQILTLDFRNGTISLD